MPINPFESIVRKVSGDNEMVGSPLDGAEKTRIINACTTSAKDQLNADGYTEAHDSLVVTVEDPAAVGNDPILLWFDWDHDEVPERARAPLMEGMTIIVGQENYE